MAHTPYSNKLNRPAPKPSTESPPFVPPYIPKPQTEPMPAKTPIAFPKSEFRTMVTNAMAKTHPRVTFSSSLDTETTLELEFSNKLVVIGELAVIHGASLDELTAYADKCVADAKPGQNRKS